MTDRIELTMNPGEAILVQGALSRAAADAMTTWRRLLVTGAPEDEQEAAKVAAQILARVDARLVEILYPACEWFRDECDRPRARGQRYCSWHIMRINAPVPA